jgi:hypothetical protein
MALSSPLDGKITVTSRFGNRTPVPGVKVDTSNHLGTDLRAAVGTAALAPADGVMYAYRQSGRYNGPRIFTAALAGNWLMTWHPSLGVYVTYAHLQSTDVAVGQPVRAGDRIGRTGNSGGVAPHLHVGVWTRLGNTWTPHDPEQFFDFTGKADAPANPTKPLEEDDMYSEQDRARDDATYKWLQDVQPKVAEIHAIVKRLEVAAGVHTWALADDQAGLRRLVGNLSNAVASIPGTGPLGKVELADGEHSRIADEIGRRITNG